MESKISVLSFIYNEEKNIDRWLTSLKPYAYEIIIFDLESTDNSFELCRKYTDKVYKRPYLLCGDEYKQELHFMAKGDALLWTYPDELFPESTLNVFDKLLKSENWNAFSFMRHEYMDGVRVCFKQGEKILAFGTPESPNYQCRLHKNDGKIFYTGLVHFELDGDYNACNLPPEYNFEHWKESTAQEFDNIRLYILYKASIFRYGDTAIEPYKRYIDSYRKIVRDSEKANLSGVRKISLAEEFWWDWRRYATMNRLTLDEFKTIVGISYEDFVNRNSEEKSRIIVPNNIIDSALVDMKKNESEK